MVVNTNLAAAIPEEYFSGDSMISDAINLQELYNAFSASSTHLFRFIMNYDFRKPVEKTDRILFFCQIASLYTDNLDFTTTYEIADNVEYPLIYFHNN